MGRVPASENNLAWRVGGPGISRSYYYEIGKEDIFVLILAELEKVLLDYYYHQLALLIQKPEQEAQLVIGDLFKSFQASRSYSDAGVSKLNSKLKKQISLRKERYPAAPVNKELILLLRLTKQFIKHQIILKDMSGYIWTVYGVRQGDYNQLVRTIWTKAFNSNDILEPFEDLEMRFKLTSDDRSKMDSNQIRQALKGQVNLEKEVKPTIVVKQQKVIPRHIQYVDGKSIIDNVKFTQNKKNAWSSHQDVSKAVYLNYKRKQKINKKNP